MKIKELEACVVYKNSAIVLTEDVAKMLPEILIEEKEAVNENLSTRIKIKDHAHFLNLLNYIPENISFILEDNNKKYVITGNFAYKA